MSHSPAKTIVREKAVVREIATGLAGRGEASL
jgi:hypothetical protein